MTTLANVCQFEYSLTVMIVNSLMKTST